MRKILLSLSVLTFPSVAAAQDTYDENDLGEITISHEPRDTWITVLANGFRTTLGETAQPLTIFSRDEIRAVQGADIARVLQRAPSVNITRNGPAGSVTSLSVRGAASDQLLVLIDGVRVADPAAPGAGYDLGNLLTGSIGKVELLRSSNSTMWGSQAVGGVMAVWTRGINGVEVDAEYGARDTVNANIAAGMSNGVLDVNINAGYFDTQGFSSAAVGSEPDGFRQYQVGGYARYSLADNLRLRLAARYSDGRVEIDGFPAPAFAFADTDEYQDTRQYSGVAGLEYTTRDLNLQANYSLSDTERDSFNPAFGTAPGFSTDGHSKRADVRGKWNFAGNSRGDFSLAAGGEREWTRFSSTFDAEKRANIAGAYAQLGYQGSGLTANIGVRANDHSQFGSAVTFGADAAWMFASNWRVRASFGEGFKAPSLYQLYSDYGNITLTPERSTSVDVGVEMGDRGSFPYAGLSLFLRKANDQVDFVSCFGSTSAICVGRPFGTYDNIGKTRARGIELEGGVEPVSGLQLRGVYAFVDAQNRTPGAANFGNDLARRPRHLATFSADWQAAWDRLWIGADVRVVSRSFDNAAGSVRLDGYQLLDLRMRFELSETVELFGRVENVWDEDYQTAAGYGTAGRGAHIGARARF